MNTSYWLNHVMNTMYNSAESSFYVGLSSTPIDAGGRGATEPTDAAYTRMPVGGFSDAVDGVVVNRSPIKFTPASQTWFDASSPCSYYILYDGASSDAHILGSAALETPVLIDSGMSFYIPPRALRITLFDGDTHD